MIFERRFEKRGDIRFRDAALLVAGHQRFEVEQPAERLASIVVTPDSIELAVIRAIRVNLGCEPRSGLRVADVIRLPAAIETRQRPCRARLAA